MPKKQHELQIRQQQFKQINHENQSLTPKNQQQLNLTLILAPKNRYTELNILNQQKAKQISRQDKKLYIWTIDFPFKTKKVCLFAIFFILIIALTLGFSIFQITSNLIFGTKIVRPFQYVCRSQQLKENLSSKFKMRQKFRGNTPVPQSLTADRYEFKRPVDQIVQWNNLHNGQMKQPYQTATRLMQVTHNVNFKGQFVFDNYDHYTCPQQKYLTLKTLLDQQQNHYNQKYQIKNYIHDQLRFCVVIVSYNNVKTRLYLRNLDSIFQQNYNNYHIVYTDDVSTDGTGQYVEQYMKQNQIPQQKYTIVKNKEKHGGSLNFYLMAHQYCKQGEIMVLIDGDDSLIGRQVFSLQNAIYQKNKAALTFGQLLGFNSTNVVQGWSRQFDLQAVKNGQYRLQKFFRTCHLKTMYADLYRKLNKQDLQYRHNGSYINHATDAAIMIPLVQMAQQKGIFVDEIIYEYTLGDGINENGFMQGVAHDQIRLRTPKKKLQDLGFADNPSTTHYQ